MEEQREYLIRKYISKSASMTELCDECGISRKTGYKWHRRYLEEKKNWAEDKSKAPKKPKRKFCDEKLKIALDLKLKYLKYGPKKILAMLKKKYPGESWPGATRLYQVFKDHHLVISRKLRRRVPRTQPLSDVNHSNDTWCADFKGWFLTKDDYKIEPFTLTDAHSRYLIRCQHMNKKTAADVWRILSEAFYEYGLPRRFRTDNGPPFGSVGVARLTDLSVNLIKAGVIPEWIEPGHPEQNGRHERFHKSLKLAIATPPADQFNQQIQWLESFVEEYNFDRPHEALNQEVPGSVYVPSSRKWDGKFRSPEYDTKEHKIRKICVNGCMHWKGRESYVGQVLRGEYVGLKEIDNGYYQVSYGPLIIGHLTEVSGFERIEYPKKKRIN